MHRCYLADHAPVHVTASRAPHIIRLTLAGAELKRSISLHDSKVHGATNASTLTTKGTEVNSSPASEDEGNVRRDRVTEKDGSRVDTVRTDTVPSTCDQTEGSTSITGESKNQCAFSLDASIPRSSAGSVIGILGQFPTSQPSGSEETS